MAFERGDFSPSLRDGFVLETLRILGAGHLRSVEFQSLFSRSQLSEQSALIQLGVITLVIAGGLRLAISRIRRSRLGRHLSRQVGSGTLVFSALLTNRLLVPEVPAFRPVSGETLLTLQIGCIVSFAWLLLQAMRGVRRFLDEHFDIDQPDNLRSRRVRTQVAFIERIFGIVVVIVTSAIVVGHFESGRRLSTGLLASAGVASLVIGLAAQRTLANLLAGFQIAFTSPIRIDDAVVLEGEWGWIEEISLTYVVVRAWDRRRLIVPITYFVEKPFQNWTRKSGQILGSVFLEVAHHTPFEPLERELFRLLDEHPKWDRDARVLQVVEMKERTTQLRALMTARSSPECWDLRCAIRRGLIEFLVQHHPDCLPAARLSLVWDGRVTQERAPADSWIEELRPAPRAHDSSPHAG